MANFQTALNSTEDWELEIGKPAEGDEPAGESGAPGYLQVVDCHQGWCGPCKAITTTLRKIFFEFGERPLKMYTANVDEVKHLEKYRGSCQPVFLFYMDNNMLEVVTGLDAPKVTALIMEMLPEGAEE